MCSSSSLAAALSDRCSWLFQWASILFVVATEVRQEPVESESWQQELDAGILAQQRNHSWLRPDRRQRLCTLSATQKNLSHLPRQREQECLCHAPTLANSPGTVVKMHKKLDNQALNQAFFESNLACVCQGPKHALLALYALPFSCQHSSPKVVPRSVVRVPDCE